NEKKGIEQPPPNDITAFAQYNRAVGLMRTNTVSLASDKENLLKAIELLNSAVARDPSYYAAFGALVNAHDALYTLHSDHTPERLAASEAALQQLIKLHPDAAETHQERGSHLYGAYRDYKGALSELEAARGIGLPNNAAVTSLTGFIMRREGKHEEGIRGLKEAITVDPLNTYLLAQLS